MKSCSCRAATVLSLTLTVFPAPKPPLMCLAIAAIAGVDGYCRPARVAKQPRPGGWGPTSLAVFFLNARKAPHMGRWVCSEPGHPVGMGGSH